MATNKTIQPSGETIVIPDFDEKPDARVYSQDISKLADNDNALNQAIAKDWNNWYNYMSQNEQGSGASFTVQKIGKKLIVLNFVTIGRAHAENDVIATLPTGYEPITNINFIAYHNGTPIVLRINESGTIVIWLATGITGNGRIYGSVTYVTKP